MECESCRVYVESRAKRAGTWSPTKEFKSGMKSEVKRIHAQRCLAPKTNLPAEEAK